MYHIVRTNHVQESIDFKELGYNMFYAFVAVVREPKQWDDDVLQFEDKQEAVDYLKTHWNHQFAD